MKYNELFRLLNKAGWFVVRQSGSHVIMRNENCRKQLTVPFHGSQEVKKGLLLKVLKEAGIKTSKR